MTLQKIIHNIQDAIESRKMTKEFVKLVTEDLYKLGYKYNYDSFPKLVNTENLSDESGSTPNSLAEALLWKLGRWNAYKNFCNDFFKVDTKPTKTNVVFYAYGQHLKDKNNPIYDQHALRAIWAISPSLSKDEKSKCKNVLMTKNNIWKDAGSGKNTIDCYNIFLNNIEIISLDGASKEDIDHLLMPLGQAIKKNTKNYSDFNHLCGWVEEQ